MIRKPVQRKKALQLRKQGKSVKEIASILKVSSSTVSLWVRHIQLSELQKQRLVNKVFDSLQKGRIKAQEIQSSLRSHRKELISNEALAFINKLSERDLFIAGIVLYWAEGFKKDNRLGFANSDPAMIKIFLKWLELFNVPKSQIRLRVGLNISHYKRADIVQKYWSQQTEIPLDQFQKTFFQKFKWKKEFLKPEEYFGVLRIRANMQGELFTKIHVWLNYLRTQNDL